MMTRVGRWIGWVVAGSPWALLQLYQTTVEDVSKAAAAAITAKHSRLNSTVWIISIGSDDSAKWRGLPRDHPAVLIVADLVLPFRRALKSMT